MNSLIRKLKICTLVDIKYSDKELKIIRLITTSLSDLNPYKNPNYDDYMFYMNNRGECVLRVRNNKIHVKYYKFWHLLEQIYDIEYKDIQYLLKPYLIKLLKYTNNDIMIMRDIDGLIINVVENNYRRIINK